MKQCKNPTCTAPAGAKTYCSRRCQLTMRNVGGRGQLPDIWVGMDTERVLRERADLLDLSVRELIIGLIESAFPPHVADTMQWPAPDPLERVS